MGCYCHPSTHYVIGSVWTVRKQRFLEIQILETYKMPSKKISRIRNCIHITVILYFHLELMCKYVSLKILGLKLDCMIV